jgi:hypothetical protein
MYDIADSSIFRDRAVYIIEPFARMVQTSHAVRLMLAPTREYGALVAAGVEGSWLGAAAGPARLALLLGLVTSIAATGRVTCVLAASQMICWSFVAVLQFATASLVVRSVRGRRVGLARGIELWFAAHGPWSFWLVLVAVIYLVTFDVLTVAATAVVPAAWTAYLLWVCCRDVLGLSGARAFLRILAHQLITAGMILVYVELATQLLVRLEGRLVP